MQIEPQEDGQHAQEAKWASLNPKEAFFLAALMAGVVVIGISTTFSAEAQVAPPASGYSVWPAYHPDDRAFLCGESATPPSGYTDRMNGAIAMNLEYQRKRRTTAFSEREVIESIQRGACPQTIQTEAKR